MSASEVKNVITIGASAGGIQALCSLLRVMPEKLDAAVFAVIHIPKESMSDIILHTLKKYTALHCRVPDDGEQIKNNTLYLAPANNHMMVAKDKVLIRSGARENHWRPSIDVLFRSAAVAYDSCVTGIILTGLLDDGTSGMLAIKKSGGICIVQEPGEAEFADMPNNVLNNVDVDYRVSVSEMGSIVNGIFSRRICKPHQIPEDVKLEAAMSERMSSKIEDVAQLGEVTTLTCPDCGGVLTKIQEEGLTRYRCYTGH
ncbi:MAG: chemotaxis protein CheB, partial [Pedobacter sp.]